MSDISDLTARLKVIVEEKGKDVETENKGREGKPIIKDGKEVKDTVYLGKNNYAKKVRGSITIYSWNPFDKAFDTLTITAKEFKILKQFN